MFIGFNIKFTNTNPSHSRKMILVINPSSMLLAVGNTRFKIKKFYVLPIGALMFCMVPKIAIISLLSINCSVLKPVDKVFTARYELNL